MKKNIGILEVLENLDSLKSFTENEESFWEEYLFNISQLAKSEFIIVLEKNENELINFKELNENNINTDNKEKLLSNISTLTNRVLENSFAYENSGFENKLLLGMKLKSFKENSDYVLLILTDNNNKQELNNLIVRILLCRDIPKSYYTSLNNIFSNNTELIKNDSPDIINDNHLSHVLHIINTVINEKKFNLTCMKIVDEIANRFDCQKVSLGWKNNEIVKPIAISNVEDFLKSSHVIKSLESVFEEAEEQDIEVFFPLDKDSNIITNSHEIYAKDNNLLGLYSFPVRYEDEIISVITLEKNDNLFSEEELETIGLILNFLAPVLKNNHDNDQSIFQKIVTFSKNSLNNFVTPENSVKKTSIVVLTILFMWLIFGKMEYKVESVTTLETDNIYYVSAPYDGLIKAVNHSLGDSVKKGDLLVSFEDKELLLEKVEINSNIIRYTSEIEKARSLRKLADMKMAQAKKNQSLASLSKIDYFLEKTNIYAPFDGIVVNGDKEKIIGSPYNKGDIVMQIANPTDLYAKIKVSEEYIDEIKLGQIAELNLLSRPDMYFNVKIDKIIPMANVDDSGNIFILKVLFLDKIEDWMRPGMSGVAKVKIEDRNILWILTHKLSDFLHMHIWW